MKLLEINHLKKYFGELEVLKDISRRKNVKFIPVGVQRTTF